MLDGMSVQLKMEFSPRISCTTAKRTPRSNLEKSILLFDDVLSSPDKSLLRGSRNNPQRRSLDTRKRDEVESVAVYI